MARILPILAYQIIIIFSLLSAFAMNSVNGYARTLDRNIFGLNNKEEKLTHFRLYWHDIYSGNNPTAARVVSAPNISLTGFGFISMIDDPLTEGPELSSKLVGKAQGFYASAGQDEVSLLMIMNFVFLEGKYNGSAISIVGRNKVFSDVREMPVIGGSGLFRFARGYVEARTQKYNMLTGDATVEYNIYVSHY